MMHLVTSESHPHGVRCGVCRQQIPTGAPYMDDADGMSSDGTPMVTVRCVECDPFLMFEAEQSLRVNA